MASVSSADQIQREDAVISRLEAASARIVEEGVREQIEIELRVAREALKEGDLERARLHRIQAEALQL